MPSTTTPSRRSTPSGGRRRRSILFLSFRTGAHPRTYPATRRGRRRRRRRTALDGRSTTAASCASRPTAARPRSSATPVAGRWAWLRPRRQPAGMRQPAWPAGDGHRHRPVRDLGRRVDDRDCSSARMSPKRRRHNLFHRVDQRIHRRGLHRRDPGGARRAAALFRRDPDGTVPTLVAGCTSPTA